LGDCCNLPTTKTFWGGFYQVHVVRDNLFNLIKGADFRALYNGYTKSPIFLGQNSMTYAVHYYD
jgi:sulfide:quinone oxidoreductase